MKNHFLSPKDMELVKKVINDYSSFNDQESNDDNINDADIINSNVGSDDNDNEDDDFDDDDFDDDDGDDDDDDDDFDDDDDDDFDDDDDDSVDDNDDLKKEENTAKTSSPSFSHHNHLDSSKNNANTNGNIHNARNFEPIHDSGTCVAIQSFSGHHEQVGRCVSLPETPYLRPFSSHQSYLEIDNPHSFKEKKLKSYNLDKEYNKMMSDILFKKSIHDSQYHLNYSIAHPLSMSVSCPDIDVTVAKSLLDALQSFTADSGFNENGILTQVLGLTGMATLGKVKIMVTESWYEPTPIMLTHASLPGTQKSTLTSHYVRPFANFCKNNTLYEKEELVEKDIAKDVLKKLKKEHNKNFYGKISSGSESFEVNDKTISQLVDHEIQFKEKTKKLHDSLEHTPVKLLIDKTSHFGLCNLLKKHGQSMGCISAEKDFLSSLLSSKENDLRLLINKLFSNEPYSYCKNNYEFELSSPSFSMLNFIQPEFMKKFYHNKELNDIGLAARCLPFFFDLPKKNTQSTFVTDYSHAVYEDKITKLLKLYYDRNINNNQYTVKLEPDALSLCLNFQKELTNSCTGEMNVDNALRKLHGYAVRFAWALHAWEHLEPHKHNIGISSMGSAINLCKIIIPHIIFAFSATGYKAHHNAMLIAKNLLNINSTHGNEELSQGYITSRTIYQRAKLSSEDTTNALTVLKKHHWIDIIDNGNTKNIVILRSDFDRIMHS